MKGKNIAVKIHIGSRIREMVDKSGMTVTEFADKINYSRRNIYSIFSKESIDTLLLYKISEVLRHDFFEDFSRLFYVQAKNSAIANEAQAVFLSQSVAKEESLRKEITYLKRIIELMENAAH